MNFAKRKHRVRRYREMIRAKDFTKATDRALRRKGIEEGVLR